MSEKLDLRPSLERLCDTITRYAKGKKGIVYAIDIKHAEHIAEIYQMNGIKAIAISSKTPDKDRNEILERFRNTQTDVNKPLKENDIQVIVNVSLFPDFSVASPKISYMSNKGLICPCSSVRNKVLLMILPLGSFT